VQGFDRAEGGGIKLISHIIAEELNIQVAVLMGANLAHEVADEKFCETTIGKCVYNETLFFVSLTVLLGCKDKEMGPLFRDIIQTDYFRVVVVDDVETVEVCGALKVSVCLVIYFHLMEFMQLTACLYSMCNKVVSFSCCLFYF
jgi:glycerol-3-phosphate dehydrogenase (NAD+)